jgi:hypothetical protein
MPVPCAQLQLVQMYSGYLQMQLEKMYSQGVGKVPDLFNIHTNTSIAMKSRKNCLDSYFSTTM